MRDEVAPSGRDRLRAGAVRVEPRRRVHRANGRLHLQRYEENGGDRVHPVQPRASRFSSPTR
jgi:hypothetical protein